MTEHRCHRCGQENEVLSTDDQGSFECIKCGSIVRIFDVKDKNKLHYTPPKNVLVYRVIKSLLDGWIELEAGDILEGEHDKFREHSPDEEFRRKNEFGEFIFIHKKRIDRLHIVLLEKLGYVEEINLQHPK